MSGSSVQCRTVWRSTRATQDGATIRRNLALEPAQRITTISRYELPAGAPQHELDAVIAEDASFVPGWQIRRELEAEDEQLTKEVGLVGEDGHDDVFNVRKRTKDAVEVSSKVLREDGAGANTDDRERSVWRAGIVVDHQDPPSRVTSQKSRRRRDSGGYSPGARRKRSG
jgi:hypothetical protein